MFHWELKVQAFRIKEGSRNVCGKANGCGAGIGAGEHAEEEIQSNLANKDDWRTIIKCIFRQGNTEI